MKIYSKYSGRCNRCSKPFKKGDLIEYNKSEKRVVNCPNCEHKTETNLFDEALIKDLELAYEDDCARQCGLI